MAPTLSTPTVVVTLLSLLFGLGTSLIQTGSIFGMKVNPKNWLPWVTMGTTFVGGDLAYLKGQSPLVLNDATIFYSVIAGLTALMASSAPGLAMHAHIVVPSQVRALRRSAAAAAITLTGLFLMGCTPAQDASLKAAENLVLTDLENGTILADIETALAVLLPAGQDVDMALNVIIDELHLFNVIPPAILPNALAMQNIVMAKMNAKKLQVKVS